MPDMVSVNLKIDLGDRMIEDEVYLEPGTNGKIPLKCGNCDASWEMLPEKIVESETIVCMTCGESNTRQHALASGNPEIIERAITRIREHVAKEFEYLLRNAFNGNKNIRIN